MISEESTVEFQSIVFDYYQKHGRHSLPWREINKNGEINPYHILVSEVMLQQTQVSRVLPKYQLFLDTFPTLDNLAVAEFSSVMRTWSGLGYNRRAKYLHDTAKKLTANSKDFPNTIEALISLPGIGKNTASAILVYAYNQPHVFIETNVRSVYLHHFFKHQTQISDQKILEIMKQTIPKVKPREWYWALMDYGSYLKTTVENPSRKSIHYNKQTKFKGSKRQIRGLILKLLASSPQSEDYMQENIRDRRLSEVLQDLIKEQMIRKKGTLYFL